MKIFLLLNDRKSQILKCKGIKDCVAYNLLEMEFLSIGLLAWRLNIHVTSFSSVQSIPEAMHKASSPSSIPRPSIICGLSLLLVLYCAPRGFSLGTPVFLSP